MLLIPTEQSNVSPLLLKPDVPVQIIRSALHDPTNLLTDSIWSQGMRSRGQYPRGFDDRVLGLWKRSLAYSPLCESIFCVIRLPCRRRSGHQCHKVYVVRAILQALRCEPQFALSTGRAAHVPQAQAYRDDEPTARDSYLVCASPGPRT